MPRPDRRSLICDAALDLAAVGGTHAVTHQAIDKHLQLPRGSTSYYFRTRAALITAAAERLIMLSRQAFADRSASDPDEPQAMIVDYLIGLLTHRSRDVRARVALLGDPLMPDEGRRALAECLFSAPGAERLMATAVDPRAAADRLLTVLEGIVFTFAVGRRAGPDPDRAAIDELVGFALRS